MTPSRTTFAITLLSLGLLSGCSGFRPDNLGIQANGQLSPCPDRPNCVNSDAPVSDTEHAITPLKPVDMDKAWQALHAVVKQTERIDVITDTPSYFNVEATSRLMRFVDDVEFQRDDAQQLIQLRSASRLGYRDFGVNRERIEAWRAALQAQGVLVTP